MTQKYELTDEKTIQHDGRALYRIRYLRDIEMYGIKAGDLGGFVQSEKNLSHDGNAVVLDNAAVTGIARVFGNARVSGDAWVFGNARVFGDAWVFGNARVYRRARVYGKAKVGGKEQIGGRRAVFTL